ncbi:MAG: ABC transporter transmembrane domain-containing protein [Chloroflexota bacterium]|nr:ABC transporter transmembrane domain-containing protein [Chloroflexota bacterium]
MLSVSNNAQEEARYSVSSVLVSMLHILQLVWECHPGLTLALTFTTLFQSLTPAVTSYAGKLIVDGVVRSIAELALDLYSVLPAVALSMGLALLGALLSRVSQLAQELLGDLLSNRVNEMIIKQAISLDLSFYENPRFYDMLRRAQREAGFRPLTLLIQTLTIVGSTVTTLSLLALLLRFNPWIVLALMLTTLPALFVQARYGREGFRLFNWRTPEARKLAYYAQLLTSDRSVKEIKLFGLAQLLFKRYQALFARFYRENRSLTLRRNLAGAALTLLSLLGYYGCYVYVIARAIAGAITLGDMTLRIDFHATPGQPRWLADRAVRDLRKHSICQQPVHLPGTASQGFAFGKRSTAAGELAGGVRVSRRFLSLPRYNSLRVTRPQFAHPPRREDRVGGGERGWQDDADQIADTFVRSDRRIHYPGWRRSAPVRPG